jgi:hypothetical protein
MNKEMKRKLLESQTKLKQEVEGKVELIKKTRELQKRFNGQYNAQGGTKINQRLLQTPMGLLCEMPFVEVIKYIIHKNFILFFS